MTATNEEVIEEQKKQLCITSEMKAASSDIDVVDDAKDGSNVQEYVTKEESKPIKQRKVRNETEIELSQENEESKEEKASDHKNTSIPEIKATSNDINAVDDVANDSYYNHQKNRVTRELIQESKEELLNDSENDTISDLPGAFAVQGRGSNDMNDANEDATVQYSMGEERSPRQASQYDEEIGKENEDMDLLVDPIVAEPVPSTVNRVAVPWQQSISTRLKLVVFFLVLCVVAAVLITFFVISNKNNKESITPTSTTTVTPTAPPSTSASPSASPSPTVSPSASPSTVQQHIRNTLLEFIPDLPTSDAQERALDWMFSDQISLELVMDNSSSSSNKAQELLERFVMMIFYEAINAIGQLYGSYSSLSKRRTCDWYEVHCENYRLDTIDLAYKNLGGIIPTEVGLLTRLAVLRLRNRLTGMIPTEIGMLTDLTSLELGNNLLTGSIPAEVGMLTKLNWLAFGYNNLSGPIPTEVWLLSELQYLVLLFNSLTGMIPTEIGMLTDLKALGLSDNQLTGSIPAEVGMLTKLRSLDFGYNNLSGPIPTEVGLLSGLFQFCLESNNLIGMIPTEIGMLTYMSWLELATNNLTDIIPTEVGMMEGLDVLDLSYNNLTGSIPTEMGLLTRLDSLLLSYNNLTGSIPTEMGLLTRLGHLFLSGNPDLTGNIPSGLAAMLPNLTHCSIGETNLIGIPSNCQGEDTL